MMPTFEVTAQVWRHPGAGGWHFVTLPAEVADAIRDGGRGSHRPFGSLPVVASLGSTTWSTSLFADTKSASYLLPVKADVRRRERVEEGDTASIRLELDI